MSGTKKRSLFGAGVVSVLLAFIAFAMLGPQPTEADWRTDAVSEKIAITASAATSDQTSAAILKPTDATGVLTYLDVTAGSTLLLDVNIEGYSPTTTDYFAWFSDIPTDGGIVGVSGNRAVWGPGNTTNDYAASMEDSAGLMPTRFRFMVDHGNATAATYVLYYQWVY